MSLRQSESSTLTHRLQRQSFVIWSKHLEWHFLIGSVARSLSLQTFNAATVIVLVDFTWESKCIGCHASAAPIFKFVSFVSTTTECIFWAVLLWRICPWDMFLLFFLMCQSNTLLCVTHPYFLFDKCVCCRGRWARAQIKLLEKCKKKLSCAVKSIFSLLWFVVTCLCALKKCISHDALTELLHLLMLWAHFLFLINCIQCFPSNRCWWCLLSMLFDHLCSVCHFHFLTLEEKVLHDIFFLHPDFQNASCWCWKATTLICSTTLCLMLLASSARKNCWEHMVWQISFKRSQLLPF